MALISQSNNSTADGIQAVPMIFNFVNQNAALPPTTLFAPTITKLFRILFYSKVISGAVGPTSTLGPFTIGYTSGFDGTAQTLVVELANQLGASATTVTTNTVNSKLQGIAMIHAKAGVPITLTIGYGSPGATPMVYAAAVIVETL